MLPPRPLAPIIGKRVVWWRLCYASSVALLILLFVGSCTLTVVTLDMDIAISGVQNLPFDMLGAFTEALWELFWQRADILGDYGSSRKDAWES